MTTPILTRLRDADAATRRVALLQLADDEDADALPEVIALLADDPSPDVRLEAARILATWEQPDTVAALARALEDTDAAVREAAALGLGDLKSADSAPALLPYVSHADASVRAAALRGLRELRVPASEAPALAALHDPNAAVRREAVAVLGWRKHAAALPALAERARDDADAEVRRAAAGALGLASDASVLPALLDALRDPVWRVREESAATLGKLRALAPEAGVTHALVEALADDYWQIRLQAARALGRWRTACRPSKRSPRCSRTQSATCARKPRSRWARSAMRPPCPPCASLHPTAIRKSSRPCALHWRSLGMRMHAPGADPQRPRARPAACGLGGPGGLARSRNAAQRLPLCRMPVTPAQRLDGGRATRRARHGLRPDPGYGVQLVFSDGHARGIFPWAYLASLAQRMPAW